VADQPPAMALGSRPSPGRVAQLPYARHVSPQMVALDDGSLMLCYRLEGAAFETADERELNDLHERLNTVWRNIASERLAVWQHLVRRPAPIDPAGVFRSRFAAELDQAYRARLQRSRLFVNELYLSLVLHPGPKSQRLAADPGRLEEAGRDLAQHLARYKPSALETYSRDGLCFSQPMELVRLLLTGESARAPLVRGHLGAAAYSARLIFGREALEIRDVTEERFAGLLGVKEYPASTRPGLWNGLLHAPFPLVIAQSFAFLGKPAARALLERKQNQMTSAKDRAASQVADLALGLDDLVSNRFVLGHHQASVLVYGQSPVELADHLSRARALMAEGGLVVAREDLGLAPGFWAQFPGNFRARLRPAAITSRNFAAFAPLHTHPSGQASGNHWGPAVALLRTSAGSPFAFNFHVGDVGHTFVCGPTGSGKTVIQNFLLAQLERFGARQIFIDKDRGAEIFIRASGGTYLALQPGLPTGLAPFKALGATLLDQAFLGRLVRAMVAAEGAPPLQPSDERAIDAAIAAFVPLPAKQRSIGALRALLGQSDGAGVGARLERWRAGQALGWALDGPTDEFSLEARLVGIDVTGLLDTAETRTPIMLYLMHRLQRLVGVERLVVDIDEFWKALGDEAFRELAQDGLKTYRKQDAFMVLGTQSPADVLASPIAHTLVEQCATKIFLPNPNASERDYVEGFGLSGREFALIRHELSPEGRRFLIKQGPGSVVAELDLTGLDDQLAVLSGRTANIELAARLRREHGDDPAQWLIPFQIAQRRTA
jgi:type IV secretion system protein VirB4